jgi:hypothetical protein
MSRALFRRSRLIRAASVRICGADVSSYFGRYYASESVSLAKRDGDEVVYISAGLKDVANSAAQLHGWNQPAAVNVNIANIPMPTQEERSEINAIDRKLDAIAAKLKA